VPEFFRVGSASVLIYIKDKDGVLRAVGSRRAPDRIDEVLGVRDVDPG
jgi:hypothetical protein